MSVLFVFLDGVGLGEADAEINPFAAAQTPFLTAWLGGKLTQSLEKVQKEHFIVRQADATLGIDGLPQSATGQTALLTGKNGAAIMDRHYGPWPGPTLKRVLDEGTLFSEVIAAGKWAALANVYPKGYFWALENGKQKLNVPVYGARMAGVRLRTESDYGQARAVSADLTGAYLHAQNAEMPMRTPQESGANLAALASENDFTFLDFWATDRAGHRWTLADSVKLVEQLDNFFNGLVSALESTHQEVTLLVTSDHGNLEDKHTKSHTVNPVPLIAFGPAACQFEDAASLLDVAPAVRRALTLNRPTATAE